MGLGYSSTIEFVLGIPLIMSSDRRLMKGATCEMPQRTTQRPCHDDTAHGEDVPKSGMHDRGVKHEGSVEGWWMMWDSGSRRSRGQLLEERPWERSVVYASLAFRIRKSYIGSIVGGCARPLRTPPLSMD